MIHQRMTPVATVGPGAPPVPSHLSLKRPRLMGISRSSDFAKKRFQECLEIIYGIDYLIAGSID